MTVKDLKEKLEEYPEDYEISLVDCETACLYHAKDIKKFDSDSLYPYPIGADIAEVHKTLYIE